MHKLKFFRNGLPIILLFFSLNIYAQQLRVLVIKAHPDEAEEYAGGTAALLKEAGHAVKFLSLTNGDVGHWTMTKEAIAKRRKAEALEAGKRLGGVEYEILNYHDGELESTVEVRKEIVRVIREWNVDLIISFKPMFGGGHPDNMAAARALQEGAGLSMAPLFMPEIPALKKKPVFLFMRDYYSKSFPHKPDFVIPIDRTIEKKLASFDAHASQFYEFAPYQRGLLDEVPEGWTEKKVFLHKYWGEFSAVSGEMKSWLENRFGKEQAATFQYAEEFEYAPFSRKMTEEEVISFFPVLRVKNNN
ncbi:PIG-L family deacetylase [Limibacter armeniacum]|uniref:PIG-L deacetylase family protein n=1 Tax=Limibacter armeniacum TaxID=466084 RepID=UPI002FE653D7